MAGMPFSTEGYEFQEAIINDMHPNMDVMKPSQVGLTEVQIRKTLAFVNRNRGVSAIFTLPNDDLFRRVSQTRIKPIIDRDRVFNLEQDENSVRSMKIYQFDTSFLHVTACTEGDATSTAADAVFNDEVDLSNPEMLALFNSRMQNSSLRISQRFSTPTFQGFGIDQGFQKSDQHHFLMKCTRCNHWNWPEFDTRFCHFPDLPEHVEDLIELDDDAINGMDLTQCYVMCEKCLRPLEPECEKQWVAKFPGRIHARGYWITPFNTPRIGLDYIVLQLLKYKQRDFIRGFYNTVLGRTYSDAQTQIPTDCINKAMDRGTPLAGELPKDRPLALGLDMGQTCHLIIGLTDGNTILKMETIPSEKIIERIQFLCDNYNIVAGAVDRLPYTPTSNEIRRISRNAIMPMAYDTGKDSDVRLVMDEYDILSHVNVNRTKALDEVKAAFVNYQMSLSGFGYQRDTIIEHYRNMVRVETPEKPAVWEKIRGSSTMDHYFHATALYKAGLKVRPLVADKLANGVGSMMNFGQIKVSDGFSQPGPTLGLQTRERFGGNIGFH